MYLLLIIIIILLILERIINKSDFLNNNNNIENLNFYKKEYLLTQTELKFYRILKETTNKLNLTLFCQVSMYEIINCKDYKSFNKIKNKCIDFVITKENCKIVCCLELDDKSHDNPKRQKRDILINDIFTKVNINLIRVKVQNYYDMSKIEELIKKSM